MSTETIVTGRRRSPSRLASAQIAPVERKRKRGGSRHRPASVPVTILMVAMLLYCLLPLFWLVVNASKTKDQLYNSFALWFSGDFALFDNIVQVFTYNDGIFLRWFGNTIFYVIVGGGGAALLATLAGYGLAKYRFPGRRAVFAIILGAIAIPGSALAVPQFLLFSSMKLTNTPAAVIIPSMVSAFGLYLIWVYAAEAVPDEILEAARIDGASEVRIFFSIAFRQLMPAVITVLMFSLVATWNNYFLPLIMLSDPLLYPLPVGLNQWASQATSIGGAAIPNLVITGALLTVIPIAGAFLYLQRYWQSGLTAGSVK